MQPVAVTHAGLNGVAECMPEIEQRAFAGFFAFVGCYDCRLVFAGTLDGEGQCRRVTRIQCIDIGFEPIEERQVADQAVLDYFGQSRRQFAVCERGERGGVRDYRLRLVKRTDHIFAARMVNRGLPAHRRVDKGEQRGRHLDKGDPAQIGRRGESRQITNHSAAERDQRCFSLAACRQQSIQD